MKKLYGSFAAKLVAVILLCALVLVCIGSAVAALASWDWGAYQNSIETVKKNSVADLSAILEIGHRYRQTGTVSTDKDPNLRVTILDAQGEILWSDYEEEQTLWQDVVSIYPDYSLEYIEGGSAEYEDVYEDESMVEYELADGSVVAVPATSAPTVRPEVTPTPAPTPYPTPSVTGTPEPGTEPDNSPVWVLRDHRTGRVYHFYSQEELDGWIRENTLTVRAYVLRDMVPEGELWQQTRLAQRLYLWRYDFLWIAGLSFLAGVLIFIFLLCAAGHRRETDEIRPSFVEKIPFDLFTFLVVVAIGIFLTPVLADFDWPEILIAMIPCGLLIGLTFLLWCMSFAVRVKLHTLWSGCLIVRLTRWCWALLRRLVKSLPLIWKWVLGIGAAAFVDLIFRMNAVWSENRAAFFWFLFWLLAGAATLYAVLAFKRLRRGARAIAGGDYAAQIDDKLLVGEFKAHAEDLEHIRDGIDLAVEDRMKSERFRTELITNVSHDIKTPLTSIVSFVDLLEKEEPQTEKQREYIEVLSRQAAKLKKLIGDLIEASKASSGDLPVSLEKLDLGVLLDQTAGEYGEKLQDASLELVVQKPEEPVEIMADGRHMWRIFDNLMQNIVKYALPGTRVYLTLQKEQGSAVLTFRNISREPLQVRGEELAERFVRGDSSRSTEGSGLGLSIAMSLAKLQKGRMDIGVDGDLFKVSLRFDIA